jgi:hypothetical protein
MEAIIRPSVDSTAEASMSAVDPLSSLRIEFSSSSRMGQFLREKKGRSGEGNQKAVLP